MQGPRHQAGSVTGSGAFSPAIFREDGPHAATHRLHRRLPGHDGAGGLLLPGDEVARCGAGSHGDWAWHPGSATSSWPSSGSTTTAPPQWPDSEHPKQFHLDFEVDDVDAEQARVLALGATLQQRLRRPRGLRLAVCTPTPSATRSAFCRNEGAVWTSHGVSCSKSGERGVLMKSMHCSSARRLGQDGRALLACSEQMRRLFWL